MTALMSGPPPSRTHGPPPGAGKAVVRALGYLRGHRAAAIGAALSLVAVTVANLAAPQLVRLAVDGGIAVGRWHTVLVAVGGLLVVAAGRGLFNFLQGYLSERASQGVAFDLREGLFAHIQRLSFSYYDRVQTGQLLTRLTSDVEQVRAFVGTGVAQVAAALAMLVGAAALLLATNARLALVALAIIPPILWLLARFVRRIMPLFGRLQQSLGVMNTSLQETLTGLRVVRAYQGEAREASRYGAANDAQLDGSSQLIRAIASNFPFVMLFGNLGTLGVVWYGGLLFLDGRLTLGELLAFNTYLALLLMPILTVGFLAAQISRAGASALRIFEVLDAPLEVTDRPGAAALPRLTGRVELKDVRFRYTGGEREILQGVSFTVEPGQTVALLGTTGAGKSTVINLIPRFYDATGGAVLVDGHDVRDVTLQSLRTQIGVVLQDALLFSGSVRDNIAYGRPGASQAEVETAARAAQADGFIRALPQGYDTVVGERGVGLSGGQRQRVAIARALLVEPPLLILDDSTSAVDAETEAAIRAALDGLMRSRRSTAFVIAQRLSTLRDADAILVLDQGRIAARGTHQELLQTSELYNEILASQLAPEAPPLAQAGGI